VRAFTPRRRVVFALATGAISAALCVLVLGVLFVAYARYCDTRRRPVDRRLARLALVRSLLLRRDYLELLAAIRASHQGRFPSYWDVDTSTMLDKGQFEPVTMWGEPRYKRRPKLRVLDFTVWTGLNRATFTVVDAAAVSAALARCAVLRRSDYDTDAFGFRTSGLPPEDLPGVLFVGDSFTEGMHVASQDTFVSRFGRRLREAGFSATVFNAGVGGYGALEQAWSVEVFAERLRVRLAVAGLYLNDVHGDPRRVIAGQVGRGAYRRMFEPLERLVRFCREKDVALLVAVMPDKEQLGSPPDARVFQERVAAFCRERGVPFLDPLPRFEAQGGPANYLDWDAHFSEAGHQRFAELLFEATRELLEARFERRDAPGRVADAAAR
jgi:lysophospholipase L1-like esterase